MPEGMRLVCALWDDPGLKNCLRGDCCKCQAAVKYDPRNHQRVINDHMEIICWKCAMCDEEMGASEFAGGMVGGQVFATMEDSIKAARAAKEKEDHETSN